jgi:hypothetical protein
MCLGCLITADGSRDELIKPQRLPITYFQQLARDAVPAALPAEEASTVTGLGEIEAGEVIIVSLDEVEEDNRQWAPAIVRRVTKDGFDVNYYEPSSIAGWQCGWRLWGNPPRLSGVHISMVQIAGIEFDDEMRLVAQ